MTQTEGNAALALVEPRYDGITMAMSPAEAHRRMRELQAFIVEVMVEHVDYGMIPGTDKPTLLQPGAQKLAELYGLSHTFKYIEVIRDWTNGFFYFEVRATLTTRRDGRFVGEGLGSCNSKESKYAGRWVGASDVPPGLDTKNLQQKPGSSWVFDNKVPEGTDLRSLRREERTSRKTGRPYFVYQIDETKFFVPNPDPYSLVNTLIKMACKRAYIHAVIAATRSSGLFTQDVEDLPREAMGQEMPRRPWEESEAPAAAAEPAQSTEAAAPSKEERQELARFTQCKAELETSKDLEGLQKAWGAVNAAKKRKMLTPEHVEELGRVKNARKAAIDRAASEQAAKDDPMPAGWGGDTPQEQGDSEPPPDVETVDMKDDLGGRM